MSAGLSFTTSTGIISGTSTVNFAPTNYTITATNASGSTAFILSLASVRQYYNNAGNAVKFLAANQTPKVYTTLPTAGQKPGDIVLYKNVTTIGGVVIDCIVTTAAVNNVSSWDAYDQSAASGPNFNSNNDDFFSPQVSYGTGGGNIKFDFQFILGGSYIDASKTGTNITLQNVNANTFDIDGNGTAGATQYNEFGGFSTSELGTTTNLNVSYNNTTKLTRYTSNTATNTATVIDPKNRVRVNYNEMSDFSIVVGSNGPGLAYFFLDFSAGSIFTTNSSPAPSLDLNTTTTGVNNLANACGSLVNISDGSTKTNVATASSSDVNEFTISFPTADVLNASSEKLIINGAKSGGSINLNFANAAVIPNVILGNTYNVTATVAGGVSTLTFVRSTGTISRTSMEQLIDALQYQNTASSATNGKREFTLNIRNTLYRSPDAIFEVTLNCVGISGNHDANGLTDNTVNSNSTPATPFANNSLYAVLVDPATNKVIATNGITGSTYNFGNVDPGNYLIYFSKTAPAANSTFNSSVLPTGGYVSIGENLGAGTGNDLLVDGKLTLTVGSVNVTNANFGLQIPPVATGANETSVLNPGGFNFKTITGTKFGTSDADGTVKSITITAFPTNTNYLKVGTIVYINGGVCPPQSTCTTWPGTLTILYSSGQPTSAIAIDPIDGNTTVVISYTAKDNGDAESPASTISIPFTVPATPLQISGYVWNDSNGDAVLNGTEAKINTAKTGETLYAVLVQTNNTYSTANTIFASTPVAADGSYNFTNVPEGNNYTVRILSSATTPVNGEIETSVSSSLPADYTGVSTSVQGTSVTGLNTNNPVNTLNNFNATKINVNFGLDRLSVATDAAYTISSPVSNTTKALTPVNGLGALAGTDPEDGTKGSGSTIKITSLAGMNGNILQYNGTAITAGTTIDNYDPAKLTITYAGMGTMQAAFKFLFVDNAGIEGGEATYLIKWAIALPVKLTSFITTANSNNVLISWKTASEVNVATYTVQASVDAVNWKFVSTQKATASLSYNSKDENPANGLSYYRLVITDIDGSKTYSDVRKIVFNNSRILVTAFPNPVKDVLYVKSNSGTLQAITITSASGQVVATAKNNNTDKISMSKLPKGIYTLKATFTDGKTEQLKIVKD